MIGLKENVIIGKLVPAGTGMNRYRSLKLLNNEEQEDREAEGELDQDLTASNDIEKDPQEVQSIGAVNQEDSN